MECNELSLWRVAPESETISPRGRVLFRGHSDGPFPSSPSALRCAMSPVPGAPSSQMGGGTRGPWPMMGGAARRGVSRGASRVLPTVLALAALVGGEAPAGAPAAAPAAAAMKHHEGPYAKALEEAKSSGRPMMVDFYTSWCGWCKVMDKQVFADAGVAAWCNENIVAISIDAEKGEGVELAKKFGVTGFPTFVFLDGSGAELDRQIGYAPKEKFLPLLKDVRAGNHLKGLREQVAKKPDDGLARAKLGIRLAATEDGDAREHLEKAVELDPKDARPETVQARFQIALLDAREGQFVDPIIEFVKKYPDSPAAVDAHRIISRASQDEDVQLASLEVIVKRAPDAESRNGLSWMLATHGKDLDRALALVDAALKDEPKNFAYLDTRSECLSRLGRHDEAVESQKKAVENIPEGPDSRQKAEIEQRLSEFEKKRDEAKKK